MEQQVINFYETGKPYGCFSNFAKYPIEIQGKIWPTSEHYFQATMLFGEIMVMGLGKICLGKF